jgi:hypothetical protein
MHEITGMPDGFLPSNEKMTGQRRQQSMGPGVVNAPAYGYGFDCQVPAVFRGASFTCPAPKHF